MEELCDPVLLAQLFLSRRALSWNKDRNCMGTIFNGSIIGSAEALPILCVSDFCEW